MVAAALLCHLSLVWRSHSTPGVLAGEGGQGEEDSGKGAQDYAYAGPFCQDDLPKLHDDHILEILFKLNPRANLIISSFFF